MWLLHLLIPVAALWLLVARPELDVRWQHHPAHFWLVLFTAMVSVALGVVVGDAARRRDDDRLFLIGLAFVVAAGFLGLHDTVRSPSKESGSWLRRSCSGTSVRDRHGVAV